MDYADDGISLLFLETWEYENNMEFDFKTDLFLAL